MSRFYRMDTEPDLFGGIMLTKQWGRIGTRGRTVAERFETAGQAQNALAQHAARKQRRGYLGCDRQIVSSQLRPPSLGDCSNEQNNR